MTFSLCILFAYLCGSVPFGKIAGRAMGIDIQKKGSGNIGFANAVRVLGWPVGLAVLAGDVTKGYIPVLVAQQYLTTPYVLAVAATAIAGHLFPVWLRGRGGKGVATGLGVSLALSPPLGALGLGAYLVCIAIWKKSALSSIIGAWTMPVWCVLLGLPNYGLFYVGLALLGLWTHRTNIRHMLQVRHAS